MGVYHALVVGKIENKNDYISGLILLIAMGVMVIMSFYKFRRAFYTFFYRVHMILLVVVMLYALIHGAGGIFFGAALWGFDLLVRFYMKRKHRQANKTVKIEEVADGLLKISFEKKEFDYAGGQYVFIVVPEISTLESHPFSISSSPY